jgi:ABC-type nitrate/sulfonate/bicarbonate transport system substrate-binding protein
MPVTKGDRFMVVRVLRLVAAAVLAAALAGCASEPPAPAKPIEVNVFPGGFNWPIWVAQEKGFFAKHGVAVNITPTPNSVAQLSGLIDGKFDIAMTAIDNLIAYREGQGEAPKQGPDLVAVMGADNGFLRLVSVPEVKTIPELRGKTLSVDARTTGYAFVLFEILDRNGLREPAYSVERAGGVVQRFNALMEKKQAGTLLISPFEAQAQARGFNLLADASAALGNYQGLVAGVRKGWADANRRQVVGYIRAYREALAWLYTADNRGEAIAIFRKNLPNASEQAAETAYRILLDPKNGFDRRAEINLAGVQTVIQLREKWAEKPKKLQPAAAYYDGSFFREAAR